MQFTQAAGFIQRKLKLNVLNINGALAPRKYFFQITEYYD